MTEVYIPKLDISNFGDGDTAASRRLAMDVDSACRNSGFLIVRGHGVDQRLLDRFDASVHAFFDLPLEVKAGFDEGADVYFGYKGLAHAALSYSLDKDDAKPDLREQFGTSRPDFGEQRDEYFCGELGRHFGYTPKWPEVVAEFRSTWIEYYEAMAALSTKIMRIFALALDLPPRYFDDIMERHVSALGAYNYPAQSTAPAPGQLRGGAHTDFGSLTIVHADWDAPGGLQVQGPGGSWITVPAEAGSFVVNIGDMMQRWTNDRWVSTMHRVANPPEESGSASRRQSAIFFHIPDYEAVVKCLPSCVDKETPARYPPITIGEHQLMKMGKMFDVEKFSRT